MTRPHRPLGGVSRRQFLAGSAAAGLTIGLSPLLAGCGDGGSSAATPSARLGANRERRTLHFDYSLAELGDLELNAPTSRSHHTRLSVHTAASRAHFRGRNPLLRAVPDHRLTHFVEDVDLPADALQHVRVTGRVAATGEPALAGFHIHVPAEVQRVMGRHARAAGRDPFHSAKTRAYALATTAGQDPIDLLPAVNDFSTIFDTAVALVFHHPEILNLNLQQGTSILELIQTLPCPAGSTGCQPYIAALATFIAEHWPATESGLTTFGGEQVPAWARLVPMTEFDGTPVVDAGGTPLFRYDLADGTLAAAAETVRAVREAIFDDEQYEGTNWHATTGLTVLSADPPAAAGGRGAQAQAAPFTLSATLPAGSTAHGVSFVDISVVDTAQRTVRIAVKNRYLRFLAAFVTFMDPSGNELPFTPSEDDTDRALFLAHIPTNDQILGIPLTGDDVSTTAFELDIPLEASTASVILGSLGLGGESPAPEAFYGSVATGAFNLGLPLVFLAAGVGETASKGMTQIFRDAALLTRVIRAGKAALIEESPDLIEGLFSKGQGDDVSSLLTALGNVAIQAVLNAAPEIVAYVGLEIGKSEVLESAGLVGLAARLLSIAADLAAIGETTVEVLANPLIFRNELSLTRDLTVRIEKDPNDFQFPAEARQYVVHVGFGGTSVLHTRTGAITQGRVDPIDVVFRDMPAGGNVLADVVLTASDGTIVGQGALGPQPNDQATIAIAIAEQVLPLNDGTKYGHALKLTYQDGAHVWSPATPPTATQVNLCQGEDDALCALTGLTISQRTGMAGYGFQAGGQTVDFCDDAPPGVMTVVQNIFLGDDPDRGRKVLPCGYRAPLGIVYDRLGPASGIGRNFYLQPDGDSLLLRGITLDDTTPFAVDSALAWGRFALPVTSLALHPAGYVVGVDRENHKMEILQLPPAAVDQNLAPEATPFAVSKGGAGQRTGLLRDPVAVTVSLGAVLVLENGNRRIQAFDVLGNPTPRFDSNTTAIASLDDGSSDVVYLDLAADGLGFLFVLSFVNGGRNGLDYRLDIYTPDGALLTRTTGVAAARIAVDTFRNVYTLNYEAVAGAPRVEPSLSQWQIERVS